MLKTTAFRSPPFKLAHLVRKKVFRLRFLICLAIVLFLIFKIYSILELPPYPFEDNQENVNGLLTDEEYSKIFSKPILSDSKCDNSSMTLIAINSANLNFNRRQAIRDTWSKWVKDLNQSIIFFLSKPKDEFLQKELELENYHFNDLVIFPLKESYYLLTFKTLSIINWSIQNCPQIKYLIKCDDDMFVNYPNLNKFLVDNLNQTNIIYGKSNRNSRPNRDKFSRWYMPYESWKKEFYPEFVDGPLYVITADLLPKLMNATSLVKPIYLEDVYVTGSLREQIPGAKILYIKDLMSYHFFKPTYCMAYTSYSYHKIEANGMRDIYNNYDVGKSQNASFICSFFTILK